MIKLDIQSVIFFYVCFTFLSILTLWLFSRQGPRMKIGRGDEVYTWKCSICSHDYIDSKGDDISTCPVCGSYNKRTKADGAS